MTFLAVFALIFGLIVAGIITAKLARGAYLSALGLLQLSAGIAAAAWGLVYLGIF